MDTLKDAKTKTDKELLFILKQEKAIVPSQRNGRLINICEIELEQRGYQFN